MKKLIISLAICIAVLGMTATPVMAASPKANIGVYVGDTFCYRIVEENTGRPNSTEVVTITDINNVDPMGNPSADTFVYLSLSQTFDEPYMGQTDYTCTGYQDMEHMWSGTFGGNSVCQVDGFNIWLADLNPGPYTITQNGPPPLNLTFNFKIKNHANIYDSTNYIQDFGGSTMSAQWEWYRHTGVMVHRDYRSWMNSDPSTQMSISYTLIK